MADVNYVNPASFMPPNEFKANGLLGGIQHGQQMDDYRKLMETQFFLQEIAKQRAAQEQSEFMEGAPVRSQKRTNEMETLQGEQPFLRDVAGQRLQTEGAGLQYKRKTEYSGDAQKQFFADLRKKSEDQQWERTKRELQIGGDIANQAQQIAETQGQAAAMGYVQQQIARMKQAGVTLPEGQFMNPQGWKGMANAARNSIKQMQEIDQQAQKDNASMERTKVTAGATVDAAALRAKAAAHLNRPPKNDKEALARYREIMIDPDVEPAQREQAQRLYKMTVDSLWNEHITKREDLKMAAFQMRSPDKARAEQGRRAMTEAYQQFIQNLGVQESNTGSPQPQSGSPKPKTSGQRVKVKSPDGRIGYIPAEQLEAAKKQGYQESK